MTDIPASAQRFVLTVPGAADQLVERVGELDFYRPVATARAAAILFVHGGPGPPGLAVRPRDWPVYQGYAAAAAERGIIGVTVDHRLIRGLDQLAAAADDVEAAVGVLRADRQVDPNRIALWFFSGAGLLAGEWLDSRPDWLRCVALTYPRLATPPGTDELVSAIEVIGKHKDLPVLLTKVGLECEELAGPVEEFVSAGGAALDIIDVPKGQHGFDMLDHTDESRAAVTKALDWAIAHLGAEPGDLPIPAAAPTATPTATRATPTATPTATRATPTATPTATRATATIPSTTVPTPPVPAATIPAPATVPAPATATIPAPATPKRKAAPVAVVTPAAPADWPVPPVQAETPAARVVAREHAAYDAHDLESFLSMYSPTARLQLADGTVKTGRRSLREYYGPSFETGRCKTEVTLRMTLGEWVVDQSISHGSDDGPVPMIALYRVQDGLIVEVRFLV